MPVLTAQALDAAAFAPYGEALLAPAGQRGSSVNQGTGERFDDLVSLNLSREAGRPCLAIFRSTGVTAARPIPLRLLERHRHGSQLFVPLASGRLLAVVASSDSNEGLRPNEFSLQAFVVAPGQGINLRAGVWHHPLITLGPADVLVLERQALEKDCDIAELGQAWQVQL